MTDQRSATWSVHDPMQLGDMLLKQFNTRPLRPVEVVQWLRALMLQADSVRLLQWIADHGTGVIGGLYLSWVITAREAEEMTVHLNNVFDQCQRALVNALPHQQDQPAGE